MRHLLWTQISLAREVKGRLPLSTSEDKPIRKEKCMTAHIYSTPIHKDSNTLLSEAWVGRSLIANEQQRVLHNTKTQIKSWTELWSLFIGLALKEDDPLKGWREVGMEVYTLWICNQNWYCGMKTASHCQVRTHYKNLIFVTHFNNAKENDETAGYHANPLVTQMLHKPLIVQIMRACVC